MSSPSPQQQQQQILRDDTRRHQGPPLLLACYLLRLLGKRINRLIRLGAGTRYWELNDRVTHIVVHPYQHDGDGGDGDQPGQGKAAAFGAPPSSLPPPLSSRSSEYVSLCRSFKPHPNGAVVVSSDFLLGG